VDYQDFLKPLLQGKSGKPADVNHKAFRFINIYLFTVVYIGYKVT